MEEMAEQIECGICYDIMHQVLSITPCVHNFCGGCFSDWAQRQKDCPTCRNPIEGVSKSAPINSLIENFLAMNPDKKRAEEDLQEIAQRNLFTAKSYYTMADMEQIIADTKKQAEEVKMEDDEGSKSENEEEEEQSDSGDEELPVGRRGRAAKR